MIDATIVYLNANLWSENNFCFNERAELQNVVLVEQTDFDFKWSQRIFLDDRHLKTVGGEFSS